MPEDEDGSGDEDAADADESFEASYARELAALTEGGVSEDRPLQSVMTKLECVIMFRAAASINVVELVLRMLRDIAATKTLKTRSATAPGRTSERPPDRRGERPTDGTRAGRATGTDGTRTAGTLSASCHSRRPRAPTWTTLRSWPRACWRRTFTSQTTPCTRYDLGAPRRPSAQRRMLLTLGIAEASVWSAATWLAQFAVQFNARNNSTLTRDDVVRRVASLVGTPHRVKLEDPELTIIVEVYQVRIAQDRGPWSAACAGGRDLRAAANRPVRISCSRWDTH